MRINEIKDKEVDVVLNEDELLKIRNAMHTYEKHNEDSEKDGYFQQLYAEILVALDVCQYGHLDNYSLSKIVEHQVKASPDASWGEYIKLPK